jgi:FMN phosphatase YigB (HAD superfamily)
MAAQHGNMQMLSSGRQRAQDRVSVLITDLDDTLFNWLAFWYFPFRTLLDSLVACTGISEQLLVTEFRDLHRSHGTVECSFLLHQIPSLKVTDPSRVRDLYGESLHAYYSERKKHLDLFPTVRETLVELRARGVLILAFTESRDFYAAERVRLLGLDGLIDVLYSPPDHALPAGFSRFYPPEHYELHSTVHKRLHHDTLKPDPRVLLDILIDCGVRAEEAIYVGDKKPKDVRMAQLAHVRDVYASYGDATDEFGYDLLKRVSHWTEADKAHEDYLRKHAELIRPTYALAEAFSEILSEFSFREFRKPERGARVRSSIEGTCLAKIR